MKINIKKIAKTGADLWNKYGDTVTDVASKVKRQIEESKERKENGEEPKSAIDTGKEILGLYGNTLIDTINSATDGKYDKTLGMVSQVVDKVNPMEETDYDIPADEYETVEAEEIPTENDEEEDTFFEDNTSKLTGVIKDAAGSGFQDPEAVVNAITALGEVANDTIKYVADQETKQEEIRAKRDVAIAEINATTECIKAYLEKTFDERSAIFNKQFEAVDEALRTGNTEMLALSLQSINALAAQSPFKSLADIGQVKQALTAGDTEWDI
jgi:hypothetical protein